MRPGWKWWAAILAAVIILVIWMLPARVGRDRVTIAAPPTVIAGGPFILPVFVTDREGRPVGNARVHVVGQDRNRKDATLFRGKTDEQGLCQARVTIPPSRSSYHNQRLHVEVRTRSGMHSLTTYIQSEPRESLHLSTDRSLYQPGQTVHARAMVLHRTALTPIANRDVFFTLQDGKKNLLFQTRVTTSAWGIAATDVALDTELGIGEYTLEISSGSETQTRTLTVSRYTLPKFTAGIVTEQAWFAPGAAVAGEVSARYFTGQPCAGATMRVEAARVEGTTETTIATATGSASAQGRYAFRLSLPPKAFALPQGGSGAILLRAVVTDAGGHQQEISRLFPVTQEAILISVLPETGAPVVGVENAFYVLTSYPDGSPAQATVKVTSPTSMTVRTDRSGIGSFAFTPKQGTVLVKAQAIDAAGQRGRLQRTLSSLGERINKEAPYEFIDRYTGESAYTAPSVLIRSDRAAYAVGDTAHLTILAPKHSTDLFLEITRDIQPIFYTAVMLRNGMAGVDVPITREMMGLLSIQAYALPDFMASDAELKGERWRYYDMRMHAAQGSRTVLVRADSAMNIALEGLETGRPGEEQRVTLRVTTPEGRGVPAAVGMSGVDEALHALEARYPGMARMASLLYRRVDDPTAEAQTAGLPATYRLEQSIPADSTAARVALAAYHTQPVRQLQRYGPRHEEINRSSVIAQKQFRTFWVVIGLFGLLFCAWLFAAWQLNADSTVLPPLALRLLVALIAYAATLVLAITFFASLTLFSYAPWFTFIVVLCTVSWLFILRWISHSPTSAALGGTVLSVILGGILISMLFPVFSRAREQSRAAQFASRMRQAATALEHMQSEQSVTDGMPGAQLRVREYFPETLLWQPEIVTDADGKAEVTLPAADTITTWRLNLIANTRDGKIGEAEIPYTVFQDFYIDLDTPVQLTVGDEIFLPVAVHNHAKARRTIAFSAEAHSGLALHGKITPSVTLEAGAVGQVLLPLKATGAGTGEITLHADGGEAHDAIRKQIPVIPAGKRIDLSEGGILRKHTNIGIEIPAGTNLTMSDLKLHLYPNPVSQVLAGLDGLLKQPYGCFEQTSSITYPNVMVLRYLRENNSSNTRVLAQARKYVAKGYQRMIGYEVKGGGFSLYGSPPAEFGLTALGLMIFTDMEKVQPVDKAMLERTVTWLKAHWKLADPLARSSAALPLIKAREVDLPRAWLDERGTYAAALSTYELAWLSLAAVELDHPRKSALLDELALRKRQHPDGVYWPRYDDERGSIPVSREAWMGWSDEETTGLAIQAFARARSHNALVREGCNYLQTKQSPGGGWHGTQATVQALRAALAVNNGSNKGTIHVVVNGQQAKPISLSDNSKPISAPLDRFLAHGRNTISLRAEEDASPAYQVVGRYYTRGWPTERTTTGSPITVDYDHSTVRPGDIVNARARVNAPRTMTMPMIELSIPPGFTVVTDDFDRMKAQGTIARYDLTGSQVILYLRELPGGVQQTFAYRLRAAYPASVTVRPSAVYPYYEPQTRFECAPAHLTVR
jgi:type II secretory pathway pseudopilin PulG